MGTRADFYIEKADKLQWQGSIAWDGYSIAEADENDLSANDKKNRTQSFLEVEIKNCKNEKEFKKLVTEYLKGREDGIFTKDGWAWSWNNSKLTDRTYLFKDGRVWEMWKYDGDYNDHTTPCYFVPIGTETEDEDGNDVEVAEKLVLYVPDMKAIKNPNSNSGFIVVTARH